MNPLTNEIVEQIPDSGLVDSGERDIFVGGAMRESAAGKGRCDLLPLREVSDFLGNDPVLDHLGIFLENGNKDELYKALYSAAHIMYITNEDSPCKTIAGAFLETAKQFEQGAEKYAPNNWMKGDGLPLHRYIDSAVRHYLKWLEEWEDEPHDRAVMFNLICAIWTANNKEAICNKDEDLPFVMKGKVLNWGEITR